MAEIPKFPDFCRRGLPETVSGFDGVSGVLELCHPGDRTVLDLTRVVGALPTREDQAALTEALFRVVEVMAIDGVIPDIRSSRRLDPGKEGRTI